jgi:3-hydroxyisobutyrate dehydrogenase-like beta-hydroxyacid dehydrogenase
MGLPMAQRLLQAGHELRLWSRSGVAPRLLGHAPGARGTACASPAELAARCEVVLLCLADAQAVECVAFGERGLAQGARRGLVVVDHSTLEPNTSKDLAARWLERCGGHWIDAPVSGGTAGARAGTLAVMAGGDAPTVEALRELLGAYAARLTLMGASGAGQAAKLVNQVIVMTTIAGLAEATRLARGGGVDAARVPAALQGGWADSVLLQTLMPRMLEPPAEASGTIRTMLKDLDAVESFAAEHALRLPVAGLVRAWLARAVAQGLGESDISQIVRVPLD